MAGGKVRCPVVWWKVKTRRATERNVELNVGRKIENANSRRSKERHVVSSGTSSSECVANWRLKSGSADQGLILTRLNMDNLTALSPTPLCLEQTADETQIWRLECVYLYVCAFSARQTRHWIATLSCRVLLRAEKLLFHVCRVRCSRNPQSGPIAGVLPIDSTGWRSVVDGEIVTRLTILRSIAISSRKPVCPFAGSNGLW